MLTGDNRGTAAYVAKELNLDIFFAEVLPEQKANKIKSLQERGKSDAPAIAQVDAGIAIGAGTNTAKNQRT